MIHEDVIRRTRGINRIGLDTGENILEFRWLASTIVIVDHRFYLSIGRMAERNPLQIGTSAVDVAGLIRFHGIEGTR